MIFPISYLVYSINCIVCLLITYPVYAENVTLCVYTNNNEDQQIREYSTYVMHVSMGFMVYNNHICSQAISAMHYAWLPLK